MGPNNNAGLWLTVFPFETHHDNEYWEQKATLWIHGYIGYTLYHFSC